MKETLFILFADGGWIEFDPYSKTLVATGDDWERYFNEERRSIHPDRLFVASPFVEVPVNDSGLV